MRNRNTRFNKLILSIEIYSVFICLIGIVVLLFDKIPILAPLDEAIDLIFFDSVQGMSDFKAFVYGMIGMMVFAFGLLTLLITSNALSKKYFWAWYALFITYLLVFAAEIYFSLVYGMFYNLVFSCLAFPLLLVLLILLKDDCIKRT